MAKGHVTNLLTLFNVLMLHFHSPPWLAHPLLTSARQCPIQFSASFIQFDGRSAPPSEIEFLAQSQRECFMYCIFSACGLIRMEPRIPLGLSCQFYPKGIFDLLIPKDESVPKEQKLLVPFLTMIQLPVNGHKYEIPGGLHDGSVVFVEAVPTAVGDMMIMFIVDNEDNNVALRFRPVSYNETEQRQPELILSYKENGVLARVAQLPFYPFVIGQTFRAFFLVTGQGYEIFVDGMHCCSYAHTIMSLESIVSVKVARSLRALKIGIF